VVAPVTRMAAVTVGERKPVAGSGAPRWPAQSGAGEALTRRRIPATPVLRPVLPRLRRAARAGLGRGVSLGFAAVRERRLCRVDGLLRRRIGRRDREET
jgi:hypothetical protein